MNHPSKYGDRFRGVVVAMDVAEDFAAADMLAPADAEDIMKQNAERLGIELVTAPDTRPEAWERQHSGAGGATEIEGEAWQALHDLFHGNCAELAEAIRDDVASHGLTAQDAEDDGAGVLAKLDDHALSAMYAGQRDWYRGEVVRHLSA